MSADIVGRHWWLVSAVIWPPKMSADKANATWQMSADKVGLYVLGADIDGWHHLTWNDSSQHCCINPTAIKGMEWKKEYYYLFTFVIAKYYILSAILCGYWVTVMARGCQQQQPTPASNIIQMMQGSESECDIFNRGSSYLIVVWPTRSCFADWSKRHHMTLIIIIEWSTRHDRQCHYNDKRLSL